MFGDSCHHTKVKSGRSRDHRTFTNGLNNPPDIDIVLKSAHPSTNAVSPASVYPVESFIDSLVRGAWAILRSAASDNLIELTCTT